jgi:hypothetical protein
VTQSLGPANSACSRAPSPAIITLVSRLRRSVWSTLFFFVSCRWQKSERETGTGAIFPFTNVDGAPLDPGCRPGLRYFAPLGLKDRAGPCPAGLRPRDVSFPIEKAPRNPMQPGAKQFTLPINGLWFDMPPGPERVVGYTEVIRIGHSGWPVSRNDRFREGTGHPAPAGRGGGDERLTTHLEIKVSTRPGLAYRIPGNGPGWPKKFLIAAGPWERPRKKRSAVLDHVSDMATIRPSDHRVGEGTATHSDYLGVPGHPGLEA